MSYLGVRTLPNFLVQKRKIGPLSNTVFYQADIFVAYKDPSYNDGSPEVAVETIVAGDNSLSYRVHDQPYEVVTVGVRKRNPLVFTPPSVGTFTNAHLVDVTSEYSVEPNTVAVVLEGLFTTPLNATLDANMSIDVVTAEANSVTLTGSGKVLVFNFALTPL